MKTIETAKDTTIVIGKNGGGSDEREALASLLKGVGIRLGDLNFYFDDSLDGMFLQNGSYRCPAKAIVLTLQFKSAKNERITEKKLGEMVKDVETAQVSNNTSAQQIQQNLEFYRGYLKG
jgi:hypothetical protein